MVAGIPLPFEVICLICGAKYWSELIGSVDPFRFISVSRIATSTSLASFFEFSATAQSINLFKSKEEIGKEIGDEEEEAFGGNGVAWVAMALPSPELFVPQRLSAPFFPSSDFFFFHAFCFLISFKDRG